ncbi:MAG: hypothetical protein ACK53V_10770, partial [Planctomycetota bacterium]
MGKSSGTWIQSELSTFSSNFQGRAVLGLVSDRRIPVRETEVRLQLGWDCRKLRIQPLVGGDRGAGNQLLLRSSSLQN